MFRFVLVPRGGCCYRTLTVCSRAAGLAGTASGYLRLDQPRGLGNGLSERGATPAQPPTGHRDTSIRATHMWTRASARNQYRTASPRSKPLNRSRCSTAALPGSFMDTTWSLTRTLMGVSCPHPVKACTETAPYVPDSRCPHRRLPEALWTLTALESLDLSSNEFCGEISDGIGKLRRLEVVLQRLCGCALWY